jgi:NADH:ubiquinone oxidoreductase subunit 5 (subunit L)/multisubunit Na+/H+ antiporter MnhA subunit
VKRVVATSTVLMVGFLWIILSLTAATTAVIVCGIHAVYKAATFLAVGRILSQTNIYVDSVSLASSIKSLLPVLFFFLAALKTGSYSATKHSTDVVVSSSVMTHLLAFLLGIGGLLIWIVGIKLTGNTSLPGSVAPNDLLLLTMLGSVGIFHCWVTTASSLNPSSITLTLAVLFFGITRITGNIGSISVSTSSVSSVLNSRYSFISYVFNVSSYRHLRLVSGLLVGIILWCLDLTYSKARRSKYK